MIKYGAHAFVWIGDWNTADGNSAIHAAAEAGAEFIEIPLLNPSSFDAKSHKRELEAAGIFATASLILPKDAHMPVQPDRALAFLTEVLEKMDALGSRYLCGCIGYHLGHLTGVGPTARERAVIEATLSIVAERARGYGINLALEACNRYETYLYNTLEDARDSLLKIAAPNLKLHADTYHMNIEEEGFRNPILATKDVLEYVHMSESHRGMVGTGTVNWDQVFEALKDANFSGYLSLESFAAINADIAAATCMWRAPKHTGPELAAGGMAFLREHAKKYGLDGA
jgi:D-psicose/D-tagatose/L-ribulose 3-epimerase